MNITLFLSVLKKGFHGKSQSLINVPGVTIVERLGAFALKASPVTRVKVGKTAGFTLFCSPLKRVAGEGRVEHLGMGEEIKHLILLPSLFMKDGNLVLHWHRLVFYDLHMKSIEVLFTNSY